MRSKGAEIVCICDAWVPHSRQLTNDLRTDYMGSFTYDVITLGGGGGFQMMTVDDEGEGVFGQWWRHLRNPKFLGFYREFFLNFPKNLQNQDESFQLFKEIFT